MTPVPVVSPPLNTRTEWRGWVEGAAPGWSVWTPAELTVGRNFSRIERRLVADPAFVVLPEVPDLTCFRCYGDRCERYPDGSYADDCALCGGSGVSPVYAATWQVQHVYGGGPGAWHYPDETCEGEDHFAPRERRQVVEWQARRVEPLPVVTKAAEAHLQAKVLLHADGRRAIFNPHLPMIQGYEPITDEPWAADLKPGMCVLRLSEWEHLEQPYTEMPCPDCGGECEWYRQPPGSNAIHVFHCGTCWKNVNSDGCVPLSVPDGVLSWIELA